MRMEPQLNLSFKQPLIVGIDIAKHKHVAVALTERPSKPFVIGNHRAGFNDFKTWLDAQAGGRPVIIGLEPTGHYGKALEEWLSQQHAELRMVSGLLTKRAKEMLDGLPLKTDEKDARVIADLVRQGKSRPVRSSSGLFENLRYLAELHARLGVERTALLNRLHRLVDLLFPELASFFAKLNSPTCLAVLKVAPTPRAVVTLGLADLTDLLKRAGRGRACAEKAKRIVAAAEQSIGCLRGQEALLLDLELLLPRLDELNTQRKRVEQEMKKALSQVDYAPRLLEIRGLGVVTLAVLLGELGDLRNYRHWKQVVKMAGLTLVESSSGKKAGPRHISKRGRPLLRKLLFMAALRMFASGLPLHSLYQRLGKTKAGSQVAVAGMRRLLQTMHSLVKHNQSFSQARFDSQPAKPGAKLAA